MFARALPLSPSPFPSLCVFSNIERFVQNPEILRRERERSSNHSNLQKVPGELSVLMSDPSPSARLFYTIFFVFFWLQIFFVFLFSFFVFSPGTFLSSHQFPPLCYCFFLNVFNRNCFQTAIFNRNCFVFLYLFTFFVVVVCLFLLLFLIPKSIVNLSVFYL